MHPRERSAASIRVGSLLIIALLAVGCQPYVGGGCLAKKRALPNHDVRLPYGQSAQATIDAIRGTQRTATWTDGTSTTVSLTLTRGEGTPRWVDFIPQDGATEEECAALEYGKLPVSIELQTADGLLDLTLEDGLLTDDGRES